MNEFNDLEELKHFGVKGMRWGVRKKGETGSNKTSKSPGRIALYRKYGAENRLAFGKQMVALAAPKKLSSIPDAKIQKAVDRTAAVLTVLSVVQMAYLLKNP